MSILVACLNVIPNRCIAKSTAPPPPALALTSQNFEPVHMNSKSLPSAVTCHRVDRMLLWGCTLGLLSRNRQAPLGNRRLQAIASEPIETYQQACLPQTPTCYSSQRDGEFKYRKTGKHVLILLTIRSSQISSHRSYCHRPMQTSL